MTPHEFKSPSEHCYDLSRLLHDIAFIHSNDELRLTGEWLDIGSSVINVEVITSRYDDSVMWCSMPAEYESERTQIIGKLTTELSIFNFIWGSIESLIDKIKPAVVIGHGGKINSACYYLLQYFQKNNKLKRYDDALADLVEKMNVHEEYVSMLVNGKLQQHVSYEGIGLYLVYKIRCNFAHGSGVFPYPTAWGDDAQHSNRFLDADIIRAASRIVLLSIQMLLLAYYVNNNFLIERCRGDITDYIDIHMLLRTIHLTASFDDCCKQLSLW